jgi:tetratricopeptide (TPR) repeat protein
MRPPLPLPRLRASLALALGAALFTAPVLRAQGIGQGFELERQGKLDQAAVVYVTTLRADTGNISALLGLERVLPPLGRLRELLPLVQRALARDSANATLRGIELRTYGGLGELDSLAAAARQWAARPDADEAPWRDWAVALEDQRLFDQARQVLLEGRRALRRPTALAFELADLAQRRGDWGEAAAEWARAVVVVPSQLSNAVTQLEETPPGDRDRVVRALTSTDVPATARRLAASLLLGWGEPARAWGLLEGALTGPSTEVAAALRQFAERAGALTGGGVEVQRVRGLALQRYADFVPGPLAGRARAEAARAFLDAGDRADARAMLERLAADPAAPPDAQAMAQGALLEVLIADGQLDAATARLAELHGTIAGDAEETLRLALARARMTHGDLDQADRLLADDSSVDALAERGWVALYRGDLTGAAQRFREAGPYAGDRARATERTAMLALLQQLDAERSPELGNALQQLARGDSAGAIAALRRAASHLPPGRGQAALLLHAGRLAAAAGGPRDTLAVQLFAAVVRDSAVGGAAGQSAAPPAAELAWAQLLIRQGRGQEAIAHLEHLILTWPTSAIVPEARRELERAKGAIPRS